jgi:hypothetical protein
MGNTKSELTAHISGFSDTAAQRISYQLISLNIIGSGCAVGVVGTNDPFIFFISSPPVSSEKDYRDFIKWDADV